MDYLKGENESDTSVFTSPFDVDIDRKGPSGDYRKVEPPTIGRVDCDGRDIYDGGYSFFYSKPYTAKFFHFDEGKQETSDRAVFRDGKRAFDIRVKELTAKRVIRDVQKIVISGTREKDCFMNFFIPINIYPREDYFMQEIPGVRSTAFDGFSVPKDYFHDTPPDKIYRSDEHKHNRTLYWNPDVKTDEQGKATIQFYNNDFCRKINISAEGITNTGMPVVLSE